MTLSYTSLWKPGTHLKRLDIIYTHPFLVYTSEMNFWIINGYTRNRKVETMVVDKWNKGVFFYFLQKAHWQKEKVQKGKCNSR